MHSVLMISCNQLKRNLSIYQTPTHMRRIFMNTISSLINFAWFGSLCQSALQEIYLPWHISSYDNKKWFVFRLENCHCSIYLQQVRIFSCFSKRWTDMECPSILIYLESTLSHFKKISQKFEAPSSKRLLKPSLQHLLIIFALNEANFRKKT